jgi:hypothetical protein
MHVGAPGKGATIFGLEKILRMKKNQKREKVDEGGNWKVV